jgi:hypothetical protein
MSDIEDLADAIQDEPPDRSHLDLRRVQYGLKGQRKAAARLHAKGGREYTNYNTAPVTLPRLKFLENGRDE